MSNLESFYTSLFMMFIVFITLFVIYFLINFSSFIIRQIEKKIKESHVNEKSNH